MSNYRVRARRHTHPRLGDERLSPQVVEWLIPDAQVFEVDDDPQQLLSFTVVMRRKRHQAAIEEIAVALQQAGYSLLDAEVDELVDRSVDAMVASALAIGGGTGVVTKNPIASAVAAIIAAVLAREVESRIRRFEVVYRFVPSPRGWVAEPLPR